MSALTSPLKSPIAFTAQLGPLGLTIVVDDVTVVPFIRSIITLPLPAFPIPELNCNSRSDIPSPLKSFLAAPPIVMVVVAAVLRLLDPLPSLSTQLNVRVRFALPLLGLLPELKVTES